MQAAWADVKARSVARQRAERDLTEAKAARETAQAALAGHVRLWPDAMTGIGLSGDATPAQAEAAIAVWQSVHVPKASHEAESHRVDAIEDDLQSFDRDVFEVVDRVAPGLRSSSAQESLARLALLERRPSEPMPFIGDDLLTSFDERRTLATLRLLAGAGQRRQIILFTHHRHVVDLAKSIQDQVIDFVDL